MPLARRSLLGSVLVLVACLGTVTAADKPVAAGTTVWEGRFTQCSYNALASVLDYFYGQPGPVADRSQFEEKTFFQPLKTTGLDSFFGWGPWTSYMVDSGKMVWNDQPVTNLKAERFSLRPVAQPEVKNNGIIVRYAPDERAALRDKLLKELARGPVVMWTSYGGCIDAAFRPPWHHVVTVDDRTDVVLFAPGMTHSVALFLQNEAGKPPSVVVEDCSVRNGLFKVTPDIIVSTSAAMTAFVRIKEGQQSMLEHGLGGIKDDEYNVVFYRNASTAAIPASQPPAD